MQKPEISGNRITIPSNHEFLSDVDMFIEGILRGYGADESIIADIAISVSELVNNAISHGNAQNEGKKVIVEIDKNSDKVSISVLDEGTGFNPNSLDDPLAEENLLKEVGRGIFIVKSLMDSVDIIPSPRGTKITMTKTIK
ncbi:MAG TPA: ATP-binding protein [candidate division Zixibacteria bacterium]|nr:ATP-binding protein [candidate division Zixibacteria bacterium]